MSILYRLCIFTVRRVVGCVYFLMKKLPQRNRIAMISRQSDHITQDFLRLRDSLSRIVPGYRITVLTKTLHPGFAGMVRYFPHFLRQLKTIATARIVILDSYCIAISMLSHREELRVIQMWHAVGLMKKAGYAAVGTTEGRNKELASGLRMHRNYDYVFASSAVCASGIANVFGCDESRVAVQVLPRADYLRDASEREAALAKIRRAFPMLFSEGKKNILYVPTHRRSANSFLQTKLTELIGAFDFDRYNLVVSPHQLSQLSSGHDSVWFIKEFTSLELAMCCDMAIVDYSSIVFELAILKVPQYFYTYDLESYLTNPGFFIDFEKEVPGRKCRTAEEVVREIAADTYDAAEMDAFLAKYVEMDEGSCADRISEFVKGLLQPA